MDITFGEQIKVLVSAYVPHFCTEYDQVIYMPEKKQQKPSDPTKIPRKTSKRKVPSWMSDDTRVVFSDEGGNNDG